MNVVRQPIIVKVDGQEFLVEVGDLSATPVIAVVDGQTFEVILGKEAIVTKTEPSPTICKPQAASSKDARTPKQTTSPPVGGVHDSSLIAPMPGDISEILVEPGQNVKFGDPICVLYAMKMKNVIRSPRDGRISEVKVSLGQSVDYGVELITYD
jgi:biotin carboxyl carrier protein